MLYDVWELFGKLLRRRVEEFEQFRRRLWRLRHFWLEALEFRAKVIIGEDRSFNGDVRLPSLQRVRDELRCCLDYLSLFHDASIPDRYPLSTHIDISWKSLLQSNMALPKNAGNLVFPVDSELLPNQNTWPRGYLGSVLAELLEKFNMDRAEVRRLTGASNATIWLVADKMQNEGYDWRAVRKELERRYRQRRPKKRPAGGNQPTSVYTEDEEFPVDDKENTENTANAVVGKKKDEEEADAEPKSKSVPGVGVQARRPVVTFKVANNEIPIDPNALFELYFIYLDIQRVTNCEEDFMEALKLAMETQWLTVTGGGRTPPSGSLQIEGEDTPETEEEELVPVGG